MLIFRTAENPFINEMLFESKPESEAIKFLQIPTIHLLWLFLYFRLLLDASIAPLLTPLINYMISIFYNIKSLGNSIPM